MKTLVLFLVAGLSLFFLSCRGKRGAVYRQPMASATSDNSARTTIEGADGLTPGLYFLPIINVKNLSCDSADIRSIQNSAKRTIARLCHSDYKTCVKQGVCLLQESAGLRMINFPTRRGSTPSSISDKMKRECPYGLGVKDVCLDPYYTIAADLKFYKLGDVVFIPSVRGLKLPNGDVHEGYFVVRDSASKTATLDKKSADKYFDFFIGFDSDADSDNAFKKLGLSNRKNHFKFQAVPDDVAAQVRRKRGYPKINRKQRDEAARFLKQTLG